MLFINEIFASIQGEATYAGMPSVFIRFQGCKCQCEFCDTKYTWKLGKPNEYKIDFAFLKQDAPRYATTTAIELADEVVRRYPEIKHIVLTGGEPCIFDLKELCTLFKEAGRKVQVETSGTEPIMVTADTWVTVSPKIGQRGGRIVKPEYLALADEIKMAVGSLEDIKALKEQVIPHIGALTPVWLQPISQDPEATKLCVDTAMAEGWKVSIQTHKYMNVR